MVQGETKKQTKLQQTIFEPLFPKLSSGHVKSTYLGSTQVQQTIFFYFLLM